jgi:hypothetical protein
MPLIYIHEMRYGDERDVGDVLDDKCVFVNTYAFLMTASVLPLLPRNTYLNSMIMR